MITGQTNVVRYYPMIQRGFAIMKSLIPQQCNIPQSMHQAVHGIEQFFDIYL
jgi:hypothetical protein